MKRMVRAMVQRHPHAGAIYKIIAHEDEAFEVNVALSGASAVVTITWPAHTGRRGAVDSDSWPPLLLALL